MADSAGAPQPGRLGPAELARVEEHLAPLVGGFEGGLVARLIAGGRSNPTYELSDGRREWVLRRPPYGAVMPSTHDVTREHRVMSALQGTAVPVPTVVTCCTDTNILGAPFFVMDKLEGRVVRDEADAKAMDEAERRAVAENLVATLVELHQVDPEKVGLGGWGRPDGYLRRQVARWRRQWELIATRPMPQLVELLDRLAASVPETQSVGIVHGDFKIDNVMLAPDRDPRVIGVLDWEMATLGDTLADLGILISFWDEPGEFHNPITAGATALPGFPTASEVVDGYASRLGLDLADVDWYVVFADIKIAVILEQIHARHVAGDTIGAGFDTIGEMVAPLVERARARAAASTVRRLRVCG